MPDPSLRQPLVRTHRAQQRRLLARAVLHASAGAVSLIAAVVGIGVLVPGGVAAAVSRLTLLIAGVVVLIALQLTRLARDRRTVDAWLELVEQRFPSVRSWLRNALELETAPARDTSRELAAAVVAEAGERLRAVPLATLAPSLEPTRPAWLAIGGVVLIAVLALAVPARTARSWRTLWSPGMAAPPVTLAVEPGSVTLTPGAALAVRARVWGSAEAPRLLEDHGLRAAAVPEGDASDGARLWRFDLTQLTRETHYRVRVVRTESARYAIRFSGAAMPVGFRIRYHAPAYARLPEQEGASARGDLSALKGSTAAVEVTFDRDLDRLDARLPDGRVTRWSPLTPRRWRGEVPVTRAGEYELSALPRAGSGTTASPTRHRYRITPLDDAPPVLFVRVPEGDLDLPAGQQVPVEVLAQDDLGLSELRLQLRRDPAAPWTDLPLARFPQGPREATVATRWDASGLGLLPGQSASFRFELFDDDAVSGRQSVTSPVFQLRFPSLADLYRNVDDRQTAAQTALEKAAEQAHELQKSLDKLARQQPQAPSPQQPTASTFERREEVQRAVERQQDVARRIEDAAQQMHASLEQANERRAFDEQLTRKLTELQDLMRQVQSPEFKQALERMQKALEQQMQNPATDPALQKMKQQNEQLLKNLERSIALLKKLREEEKLQSLARRAEELKQKQDALNQEHAAPKNTEPRAAQALADRQQKAAEETQQLAREAQQAAQDQEAAAAQKDMQQASEMLSQQAAPQQNSASQSSRSGQPKQAQKQGQKASESLAAAARQLEQAVQQMQQEEQEADLAAVRRAAQDLVSLQRSAESNLDSDAPLDSRGDRQTDLGEGAARVTDSLVALGDKNPALTPQLLDALGHAVQGLRGSGRELGAGNRGRGEQLGREGAASLNSAVLQLRDAEGGMCNKPGSGKPGGKGKPRQDSIGDIGQRQSQLNRETQSMAQRLTRQMQLSSGDQGEMRRLAEEQARIREALESVQREEDREHQLLGRLDQTRQEMKEVEESLQNGQSLDDLEEKQTRILSRLLDAQRSINRRDFEPQRESRPGEDLARSSPSELPAELLRENDRLRLDLLKAQADRYPAQYRGMVEAYLRSLNGSRR